MDKAGKNGKMSTKFNNIKASFNVNQFKQSDLTRGMIRVILMCWFIPCLALAIVSYSLWCVDPSTISRIGNDYLFWTIPIVMVILQLYSLDIEGNSYGDPIEVILSDKKLIIVSIFYIVVIGGLLYVL